MDTALYILIEDEPIYTHRKKDIQRIFVGTLRGNLNMETNCDTTRLLYVTPLHAHLTKNRGLLSQVDKLLIF